MEPRRSKCGGSHYNKLFHFWARSKGVLRNFAAGIGVPARIQIPRYVFLCLGSIDYNAPAIAIYPADAMLQQVVILSFL